MRSSEPFLPSTLRRTASIAFPTFACKGSLSAVSLLKPLHHAAFRLRSRSNGSSSTAKPILGIELVDDLPRGRDDLHGAGAVAVAAQGDVVLADGQRDSFARHGHNGRVLHLRGDVRFAFGGRPGSVCLGVQ